jgi:hypothetical protein
MENIEPLSPEDVLKESKNAINIFIDSLGEDSIYKNIFIEQLCKLIAEKRI